MCMVDDDCMPEFYTERRPKARKQHRCGECRREIEPGERYMSANGKMDGEIFYEKMCLQCANAADLLNTYCGGYLFGGVAEDLSAHICYTLPWRMQAARAVVGMRRQWRRFDGSGLMTPNKC